MSEVGKTFFFMNQLEKLGYQDDLIGYLVRNYPIDDLLVQYGFVY